MLSHDIEFTVNAGDYQGKKYRYTLATKDGVKQWVVIPLWSPPPSVIKERIEMTIMAQDQSIPRSAALELATVNKLLDELRIIAEDTATLKGIDKQERTVQIDENGYFIETVMNESTKEPEYQVSLTCWSLYT